MRVFYHKNCIDGMTAAAIMKKCYPAASCIGIAAGVRNLTIDNDGDFVFFVDVWPETLPHFPCTVFDHHKSAGDRAGINNLPDRASIVGKWTDPTSHVVHDVHFSNYMSGALMVATWYMPEVPWYCEYVSDRDVWSWKLPNSKAINAYIGHVFREHEKGNEGDVEGWLHILDKMDKNVAIVEGLALLAAEDRALSEYIIRARKINFRGRRLVCIPIDLEINLNELGSRLSQMHIDCDACIMPYMKDFGRVSLRSRENGLDLSVFCREFNGGGGHKCAGGFTDIVAWAEALDLYANSIH